MLSASEYITAAPEDGKQGASGQNIRQSEWVAGATYHNDDESIPTPRYLDIVHVIASSGVISRYMCKQTHTSSVANKPGASSAYWTLLSGDFPLYTPLIISENGEIKFLQSYRISIMKPDGTITSGMSGNGEGANGIRFWAGGTTPESANYRVDETGRLIIANGKIILNPDGSGQLANGSISWDAAGNLTVKGEFIGKIITSNAGRRFVLDPAGGSFIMYNENNLEVLKIAFIDGFDPGIRLRSYSGNTIVSEQKLMGSTLDQYMAPSTLTGGKILQTYLDPLSGLRFLENNVTTKTYARK